MTARVHDECFRRQQRFDLLEPEDPLPATRGQARSGRVQDEVGAFYLRRQRRDACVVRCALGPSERSASRLRPEASNRDPRDHQLVGGPRRGREGRGVELGERTVRLVQAPDQEEAPDLELAADRIQKIDPKTGRVLATIAVPGGGGDSGLTWAEGTLWVGQYRDRKIYQIDPRTGAILRTIESNRFVTGVTWDRRRAVARHLGR